MEVALKLFKISKLDYVNAEAKKEKSNNINVLRSWSKIL